MRNHLLRYAFALFCAALSTSVCQAQPGPKLPVLATPTTTDDLTPEQEQSLQRLRAQTSTASVEVINVNPAVLLAPATPSIRIEGVTSSGILGGANSTIVKLPKVWNLRGKPTSKFYEGVITRGWEGRTVDSSRGYSTFTVVDGEVTGSFQSDEGLFRIRPLGGNKHALIKVDLSRLPPDHPPELPAGAVQQPPSNNKEDALPKPAANAQSEVVFLALYTKAASDAAGGPKRVQGIVQNAVQNANLSYKNSGLKLTLTLAADPIATDFVETTGHKASLKALMDQSDISALRDKHLADVVVIFTNDSDACGVAQQIDAEAKNAFVSVKLTDCAADNFSLAHEIGHLQGARHDPDNDPTPGYNHGYCSVTDKRRCVMAYQCGDLSRSAQWSRPPQWGKQQLNDNTRKLRETAVKVANFR